MSDSNARDASGIRDIASAASLTANAPKPNAPVVTPDPVPSDENLMKLASAAIAGALFGSFVAYRWVSRRLVVSFRDGD